MSDNPVPASPAVDPKILAAQAVKAAQEAQAAAEKMPAMQAEPEEKQKEEVKKAPPKPQEPFYFSLDEKGLNPIVDSASHLLALLMRIRSLDQFEGADALYKQVNDEMALLDKRLNENGITEPTMRSASRFCLCATIDDVISKKAWSHESQWQNQPLLSLYHRDVRTDDELYRILSRLLLNSAKYKDVLVLFYLCLLLGYEGDYCAENGSEQKRNDVLKELKIVLAKYWGRPTTYISEPYKHQTKKAYQIEVDYPRWPVYLVAIIAVISIYLFFDHLIDRDTAYLLQQLQQLGS